VTDGQTDGQNYDPQDRASIAASRGKNTAVIAKDDDDDDDDDDEGLLVEGLTSHVTHYRSYQRRSSRSITWQVLAELNQTTTKYS